MAKKQYKKILFYLALFFNNCSALNDAISVKFSATSNESPLFVKCLITFFLNVPAIIICIANLVKGAKKVNNSSFVIVFKAVMILIFRLLLAAVSIIVLQKYNLIII